MKRNRALLLALILLLALCLPGCRARTTPSGGPDAAPQARTGAARAGDGEDPAGPPGAGAEEDPGEADPREKEEPGEGTKENPEAQRKEYDESARAEVVPGAEGLLHAAGEGSGTPTENGEAEAAADRLDSRAEEDAVRTVPAGEAERQGVSEEAEEADSALTYFTVLLRERAGSLFECQRALVYWETAQDHVTIHKTSGEHEMILTAGAYDASARLLAENLTVDDGWVVRKNPGVIVKVVDRKVLGSGAAGPAGAKAVCRDLLAREGWAGIEAVREKQVLLLSEQLLEAPHLQLAAMLMIAKAAVPDLFSDVDPALALRMLTEEAAGTVPAGTWYYLLREDGS